MAPMTTTRRETGLGAEGLGAGTRASGLGAHDDRGWLLGCWLPGIQDSLST